MQVEQLNWLWSYWYSIRKGDKNYFIKSQRMYISFPSICWYFHCAVRLQFVSWLCFNDLRDMQTKFEIWGIYGALPFSITSVSVIVFLHIHRSDYSLAILNMQTLGELFQKCSVHCSDNRLSEASYSCQWFTVYIVCWLSQLRGIKTRIMWHGLHW